jgi:hypothetical protein
MTTSQIFFDDGAPGAVIAFDCPVRTAWLRQFQAIRLDDGRLTTVTPTANATRISDKDQEEYMTCLKSIKPTKAAEESS